MSLLPKSRKARRRLTAIAIIAPVVVVAAGLTLYGLRGSISYFYTPAQAVAAHVKVGQPIQLGGLVEKGVVDQVRRRGAVRRHRPPRDHPGGLQRRASRPLPRRSGRGGDRRLRGAAESSSPRQILAKHDEKYMPAEVAKALKAQGQWRGD